MAFQINNSTLNNYKFRNNVYLPLQSIQMQLISRYHGHIFLLKYDIIGTPINA